MFLPTLKEVSASLQGGPEEWLVRSGMLASLAGASYTWLPLGTRMLRKLEHLVRMRLEQAGAQEMALPMLSPVSLWEKVGWADHLGENCLRLDLTRHDRKVRYVLGASQEPVLAELLAGWLASYRNLPLVLFQMAPVFAPEGASSSGLAEAGQRSTVQVYGFHASAESLHSTYQNLLRAGEEFLEFLGLSCWVAQMESAHAEVGHLLVVPLSDPGSHLPPDDQPRRPEVGHAPSTPSATESQAISEPFAKGRSKRRAFQEEVAFCGKCGYTFVRQSARIGQRPPTPLPPSSLPSVQGIGPSAEGPKPLRCVPTPGARTIAEVTTFLDRPAHQFLKTLLYLADGRPVAVLIRGDHEASEAKIRQALGIEHVTMADPETIQQVTGAPVGFSGPIGLKQPIPLWADWDVQRAENVVVGANQADAHLVDVWIGRDFQPDFFADLRLPLPGDPCPRCCSTLQIGCGLPVAESVSLGSQYSLPLGLRFHDAQETLQPVLMSRFQIDLTRVLAAMGAVHHDSAGLVWPERFAPFDVLLVCLSVQNTAVMESAFRLYEVWQQAGLEVLLDDRDLRPGVKFYDADLLGIPWRVVLGERNWQEGVMEVKHRRSGQKEKIPLDEVADAMVEKVRKSKTAPGPLSSK